MSEGQKMHCPACGADWFSAAASSLVASGARCLRCDGELVLGDGEPAEREAKREPRAAGNGTHPPES